MNNVTIKKATPQLQVDYATLRQDATLALVPDIVLYHLLRQGIQTPQAILDFLSSKRQLDHDIEQLQDASKALDLLTQAIESKTLIVLMTDYDTDGIMGGSLGCLALRALGANVVAFTNLKFEEGYGINMNGLPRLYEQYPTVGLIVTIDNGISISNEALAYIKARQTTLIITDHHEPASDGSLPEADAVVNAKRQDETASFREYCGAGLFYKLMVALSQRLNRQQEVVASLIDFCAIATVGDVVPLIDENRELVKAGIMQLQDNPRPVFRLFREKTDQHLIDEETFAFTWVPMINSVGRITGKVQNLIEFLISDNEAWQSQMIDYLIDMNQFRKQQTTTQMALADQLIVTHQLDQAPILMLASPKFTEGIVGIIAGQLKDKYQRPVIVFAQTETGLKGSGRAPAGTQLKSLLDQCAAHLETYGGHDAAAGMSVSVENYPAFYQCLMAAYAKQPHEPDAKEVDYVLHDTQLSYDLYDAIQLMKPFGAGFPKPLMMIPNYEVVDFRVMGADQSHLKLRGRAINVIAYRQVDTYQKMNYPKYVEVIGHLTQNIWENTCELQLTAEHLRPVATLDASDMVTEP